MFVVSRVFKFLGVARRSSSTRLKPGIGYLFLLTGCRSRPCSGSRWPTTASTTRSATRRSRRCGCPTSREAKYKAKQAVDSFFTACGRRAAGGRCRLRRRAPCACRPRLPRPTRGACRAGWLVVLLLNVALLGPRPGNRWDSPSCRPPSRCTTPRPAPLLIFTQRRSGFGSGLATFGEAPRSRGYPQLPPCRGAARGTGRTARGP